MHKRRHILPLNHRWVGTWHIPTLGICRRYSSGPGPWAPPPRPGIAAASRIPTKPSSWRLNVPSRKPRAAPWRRISGLRQRPAANGTPRSGSVCFGSGRSGRCASNRPLWPPCARRLHHQRTELARQQAQQDAAAKALIAFREEDAERRRSEAEARRTHARDTQASPLAPSPIQPDERGSRCPDASHSTGSAPGRTVVAPRPPATAASPTARDAQSMVSPTPALTQQPPKPFPIPFPHTTSPVSPSPTLYTVNSQDGTMGPRKYVLCAVEDKPPSLAAPTISAPAISEEIHALRRQLEDLTRLLHREHSHDAAPLSERPEPPPPQSDGHPVSSVAAVADPVAEPEMELSGTSTLVWPASDDPHAAGGRPFLRSSCSVRSELPADSTQWVGPIPSQPTLPPTPRDPFVELRPQWEDVAFLARSSSPEGSLAAAFASAPASTESHSSAQSSKLTRSAWEDIARAFAGQSLPGRPLLPALASHPLLATRAARSPPKPRRVQEAMRPFGRLRPLTAPVGEPPVFDGTPQPPSPRPYTAAPSAVRTIPSNAPSEGIPRNSNPSDGDVVAPHGSRRRGRGRRDDVGIVERSLVGTSEWKAVAACLADSNAFTDPETEPFAIHCL